MAVQMINFPELDLSLVFLFSFSKLWNQACNIIVKHFILLLSKQDILENGSSVEVQGILSSDFFKSMEVCFQIFLLILGRSCLSKLWRNRPDRHFCS